MGSTRILQAVNKATSIFASTTISQKIGQYSRVGVASYASSGKAIFTLDHFNSTAQFTSEMFSIVPGSTTDSNGLVSGGLDTASQLLQVGRLSGSRNNVPQAVIIFVAEPIDQFAVLQAVNLMNQGISILAIDASIRQNLNLTGIASPNMTFRMNSTAIVQMVQDTLCIVNAHCPNGWTQVVDLCSEGYVRYGECIRVSPLDATAKRTDAASNCAQLGGILASEFDKIKHDFVAKSVALSSYWIGLQWQGSSGYVWDENNDMLVSGDYTDWDVNQPSNSSLNTAVVANASGWSTTNPSSLAGWICQVHTCDTDSYC